MEIKRNLRIYGDGTKYYLTIEKPGLKKQLIYFDSKGKLRKFMKKYKKRIIVRKPKIANPKKEVNNIMDNLGFAKTIYTPIPQSELIKQEKIISDMQEKLKWIEPGDNNKMMLVLQKTLSNITYNQIKNEPEIKQLLENNEITKDEVKAIVEKEIKKEDYDNEKIINKIDKNQKWRKQGLPAEQTRIRNSKMAMVWREIKNFDPNKYDEQKIKKLISEIPVVNEKDREDLEKMYDKRINDKILDLAIKNPVVVEETLKKEIQKIEEPEEPPKIEEKKEEPQPKPKKEWKKTGKKKEEIQTGDGVLLYGNGISNYTIDKIMKKNFKWFGYIGCFSFDELETVYKYIIKNKLKYFSFILNTANNNKDKINPLHWIAVFCDGASIEYYDCWGKNIRLKDFQNITAKYLPSIFSHYLKFKYNTIKNQSMKSNTCGYFAMKFLISRYIGISFKDATNYKNVNMNEKNINEFRKNINKFGLL